MNKMFFTAAMAALFFASFLKDVNANAGNHKPNKNIIEVVLVNELASTSDTKALFNTTKWAVNDEFSIFDGVVTAGGGTKFTVSEADSTTFSNLSGEIRPSASGPIYLLFPYQTYSATRGDETYKTNISDGIIFPVEVPYMYSTAPEYLPTKSLALVGKMPSKGSTDPVTMKTPMGFVKFHLDAGDMHPVTKIELTCKSPSFIGGTVAVDYTGDEPEIIMQGSGEGVFAGNPALLKNQQLVAFDIIVTPKDSDSFIDGDYYFALPPKTYAKGICFKFTDNKGNVAMKDVNSNLVVSRAKINDLGKIVCDDLPWNESIDLRFLNAVTIANWPFNETKPSIVKTNTLYLSANTKHTFSYGDNREKFIFKTGNYEEALRGQTGFCLKGTSKDAYVEIPGRPGKRIVNIFLRVGALGANCGNPFLATAEPEIDGKLNTLKSNGTFAWLDVDRHADAVQMDAWWSNKQYGMQKRWSDFDATGERNFRIYVSNGNDSLRILNLLVQYEDL